MDKGCLNIQFATKGNLNGFSIVAEDTDYFEKPIKVTRNEIGDWGHYQVTEYNGPGFQFRFTQFDLNTVRKFQSQPDHKGLYIHIQLQNESLMAVGNEQPTLINAAQSFVIVHDSEIINYHLIKGLHLHLEIYLTPSWLLRLSLKDPYLMNYVHAIRDGEFSGISGTKIFEQGTDRKKFLVWLIKYMAQNDLKTFKLDHYAYMILDSYI